MKKINLSVKSKITLLTILIFAGLIYYNFEKNSLPGQKGIEIFSFFFYNTALAFGMSYFIITWTERKKKDNLKDVTEENKEN